MLVGRRGRSFGQLRGDPIREPESMAVEKVKVAITTRPEIDSARAIDLIREPESMAVEKVKVAIVTRSEIDIARAIDLIRDPESMAVRSTGREGIAAGASHAWRPRHV